VSHQPPTPTKAQIASESPSGSSTALVSGVSPSLSPHEAKRHVTPQDSSDISDVLFSLFLDQTRDVDLMPACGYARKAVCSLARTTVNSAKRRRLDSVMPETPALGFPERRCGRPSRHGAFPDW
jgi:hypothetical protein